MTFNSSTSLSQSNVAFGTSGARGLVTDFTPEVCAAFTHAFISVMQQSFAFDTLAIAIDNRPSSVAMAQACAAAAKQANVAIVYYGVIPTPALAYTAMQQNIPSIMVTGSHIPFDRNGLKFYRPDGEIEKQDEQAILNAPVDFTLPSTLSELIADNTAAEHYIQRYTSIYSCDALKGKRIGIYEHSSAGRDLYPDIFTALGAEVVSLERTDTFVPIDTEAVSKEDQQKAKTWSKDYGFDAIFSTDGDGDRPLVADEEGNWLRGDILGLLCSRALNVEALAIPVSCNTAVELSRFFSHTERTRIGSPYVIAEFANLASKYQRIAGFEANGGFLLGSDIEINNQSLKALPTRDAVLPFIAVLVAAEQSGIKALVDALPKRFTASDRIQNFATDRSRTILTQGTLQPQRLIENLGFDNLHLEALNTTDGLRMVFNNGDIIHLRPSGNAPELRCYAEAAEDSIASNYVAQALEQVQKING
ncbi:phosphomannomutase [Vibrio variabilis]|uniref:phosphomannomutase n=1 Tax=Vibrio variabilis TaxID=990271 RepID=UPI000DD69143|nr:phosphomannomutase [Vibrio variabilis]